jgi:putative hydrolase
MDGFPLFGEIAKLFASQGPIHWDAARQFAALTATGGEPEPNVDPTARIRLAELADVAARHVETLLPSGGTVTAEILPVTPGAWAQRTLDAYRPLFTELGTALTPAAPTDETNGDDGDPAAAMLAGISRMMAPAMLGMAVGGMVGQLARRAFGQYDLPIPRPAANREILVIPQAIDTFADDWSIPPDEMRMWVLVQELAAHSILSVPHIAEHLVELVRRHVGGFRPDPNAVVERLSAIDPTDPTSLASLEQAFSDPTFLLGAVGTADQSAVRPQLDAALAVIIGVVDDVVDRATGRVLGDPQQISEAVRRRRVESSPEDAYVERLLGLHADRALVERGRAFVGGVLERAGHDGLAPLLTRPGSMPTPAEVDAPGLWLARLELDA